MGPTPAAQAGLPAGTATLLHPAPIARAAELAPVVPLVDGGVYPFVLLPMAWWCSIVNYQGRALLFGHWHKLGQDAGRQSEKIGCASAAVEQPSARQTLYRVKNMCWCVCVCPWTTINIMMITTKFVVVPFLLFFRAAKPPRSVVRCLGHCEWCYRSVRVWLVVPRSSASAQL